MSWNIYEKKAIFLKIISVLNGVNLLETRSVHRHVSQDFVSGNVIYLCLKYEKATKLHTRFLYFTIICRIMRSKH